MAVGQEGIGKEAVLPAAAAAQPAVRAGRQPRRRPLLGGQVGAYAVVALVSFISLYPLYWMFINSFRADADITNGVALLPGTWHFSNYSTGWNALEYPFQTFLINSFVLSVVVVIGNLLSCLLIAYGFARFRFPGRDFLFAFVLATTFIPGVLFLIPQYVEFVNFFHWDQGGHIGSYNNLVQFLPLVVPAFFGSSLWIFLLRQFIRGIPYDLDEAAKIDGAGPLRILWKVILPEVRPALAAMAVIIFFGKWNDLLWPLVFLQDPKNWTIEVALLGYFSRYGSSNWGEFMAMALITILPLVVIYFFTSKQIIQGVTLSGVKG